MQFTGDSKNPNAGRIRLASASCAVQMVQLLTQACTLWPRSGSRPRRFSVTETAISGELVLTKWTSSKPLQRMPPTTVSRWSTLPQMAGFVDPKPLSL